MSLRNIIKDLHARVPEHRETEKLRTAITESMLAAERFANLRGELEKGGRLTPQGQREALKEALTRTFARDLRDAKAPIADAEARLNTLRNSIKVKPSVDRSDVVGELQRQELRSIVAEMPASRRSAFVTGTNDPRILEAVLGAPAVVSNLDDSVFDKLEQSYQKRVFTAEMQEIAALEAAVTAAQAAATLARSEIQKTIGLDARQFNVIMKPIEDRKHAPWLLKDSSGEVLVVVPGESTYKPATQDELRDGVFYKNLDEYQQARAA